MNEKRPLKIAAMADLHVKEDQRTRHRDLFSQAPSVSSER